jgi:hypothetical protein
VCEVLVTLVHGTRLLRFARRASWTKASSPLSQALKQAHFEPRPFRWSGRNSHYARLHAGHELSEQLLDQARQHPGAQQIVIGHSHGGNVALYAVRELQSLDNHEWVRVITLATPFIHVRKRRLPPLMLACWSMVGLVSLVSSVTIIPLTGGFPEPNLLDSVPIVAVAVMYSIYELLVIRAVFRGGWRPNRGNLYQWLEEWTPQWLADLHSPNMDGDRLMVVRASGDEATSVLIAGQFFSLLTTWLTAVSRWPGWIAIPILAGIGFYIYNPNIEANSAFFLLMIIAFFVVAAIPLFIATWLVMTASLAFGSDGPLASMFAFMSAESTPPGRISVIQLEPLPERGMMHGGLRRKRRLAHSSLYDDAQVIDHVITAIRAWRDNFAD